MATMDRALTATAVALVLGTATALMTPSLAQATDEDHILVLPDELDWQDGPPTLPPGAQFVILQGNPAEEGPLALRLKFPAGFSVPPHMHPAHEHVTVLEGTFHVGMGEEFDEAKGMELPVGAFVVMPAGQPHFAWVEEPTVVQLHSTGPFGVTYVNPDDDPRTSQ